MGLPLGNAVFVSGNLQSYLRYGGPNTEKLTRLPSIDTKGFTSSNHHS
jgi:hypothetical protein